MSLEEAEIQILKFFNQPFFPLLNLAFAVIIFSIYAYILGIIFLFYRKKEVKKAIHLIASLLIGMAFVVSLKFIVGRERPYVSHEDINYFFTKADPSFPSTHAFVALLCLCFIPKDFPTWLKILIIFYLVILIPIGSLYIGVHYPSDVIVGGLLGLLFPKAINEEISVKIFKKIFRISP